MVFSILKLGVLFIFSHLPLVAAQAFQMADTANEPTATDVESEAILEGTKKVAEIEAESEEAERRSNFWALVGVVVALVGVLLTLAAGLATFAAYRQARRENQVNERLRKADQHLADLRMEAQRTATAKVQLELLREQNERELLTAAIAPRVLEVSSSAQALKQFKDMQVILFSANDNEANSTRSQLRRLLDNAGWKVLEDRPTNDWTEDGITIESPIGVPRAGDQSPAAAIELVYQLISMRHDARTFPADEKVPINTLTIKVGRLPSTYLFYRTLPDDMREDIRRSAAHWLARDEEYAQQVKASIDDDLLTISDVREQMKVAPNDRKSRMEQYIKSLEDSVARNRVRLKELEGRIKKGRRDAGPGPFPPQRK